MRMRSRERRTLARTSTEDRRNRAHRARLQRYHGEDGFSKTCVSAKRTHRFGGQNSMYHSHGKLLMPFAEGVCRWVRFGKRTHRRGVLRGDIRVLMPKITASGTLALGSRRTAWWISRVVRRASNGRTGLRISTLRQQPSHALLRLSDHRLHKGLHDSRDRFTGHTHSAAGLPAVFDQLVYFDSQTVRGRSDDDLVFRSSHLHTAFPQVHVALLPKSPPPHKLCPKAWEPICKYYIDRTGALRKGALTGGAGLVNFLC